MATMLMQALYRCVAGIDVHKKMVMVCVLWEENGELKRQIRSFSTVFEELDHLKRWLKTLGVTHVAMESTGVYWKPVFYALENDFEVLLGNARHIKNVPGRKTDVKDCEWIASLLRCGLIRGSFVPPEPLRDLRDLTRYRVKLVQTLNREKNRVQKVLEDAQIKLSSVVSDVFGKTGSGLLEALLEGEEFDEETLKTLVERNVRASLSEIQAALQGRVREHHRFMIQAHLDMIAHTTEILQRVERQIETCVEPYAKEWELLQTIPGVDETAAAAILAEVGPDMKPFPSEDHLASWAGMCPGNNESAGKKKVLASTQGT